MPTRPIPMTDRTFKRTVWAILLVAATLRVAFLLTEQVLPVMWDARRYSAAAIGIISHFDTSARPYPDDPRQDRYAFLHYTEKYIQGEQIEWLHYSPFRLSAARQEVFVSGPLYPAVLAAVFVISPAADFTVMRVIQVAMDLLSVLLLAMIGRRFVGRVGALIAGGLYAIYFPFIQSSSQILIETSTMTLTLAALHLLIRAVETRAWRVYVIAGFLAGLLVLHKATATLLFIPLLVGWFIYARTKQPNKLLLKPLVFTLLPVLVILVAWMSVVWSEYGRLGLRDPDYAAINLRQSSATEFEGYDRDEVEPGFENRPVYDSFFADFDQYLLLFAKKFERFYSKPGNDFQRRLVWQPNIDTMIHQAIVALGLIGLLGLLLRYPSIAAWPWLIVLYYTGVHLVFHSVSRYNFAVMPMLILGAGYLAAGISRAISSNVSERRRSILLSLVLLLIAWWVDYSLWARLDLPPAPSRVVLALTIRSLLILVAVYGLTEAVLKTRAKRVTAALVAALVISVAIWTPALSRDGWAEFETRLDSPDRVAGARIYMTDLRAIEPGDVVAALFDVKAVSGNPSFTIKAGADSGSFKLGDRVLRRFFYPKNVYEDYANLLDIDISAYRQYAVVPLNADSIRIRIRRLGYLDLQVSRDPGQVGIISTFGQYEAAWDESVWVPSPRFTSVERFVHRGDPRIRQRVEIQSDSAICYYIGRQETDIESGRRDLSGAPGPQPGRFNMFIVHFSRSGRMLFY